MYVDWARFNMARWLSWLKRLTSNEEIPSSNLGRAFLFLNDLILFLCDKDAFYFASKH